MSGANGACLHTSQRHRTPPCAVIRRRGRLPPARLPLTTGGRRPSEWFPRTGTVRYPPRVSRISVISDGTPKRFGGPQYPVPRLV